jgi:hypothetical protein
LFFPVFLVNSFWLLRSGYARHTDFSHYWQAGRMLLLGKNVYDSQEWQLERARYGVTPSGTEATFLYPLPMVTLLVPFGLLTVEAAYFLWVLLGGMSILISTLILFSYHPRRTFVFEILAFSTVFLFRPTMYIIPSGQITAEILLFLVLSVHFFGKGRWFFGGLVASMSIFKPSLGIPFLGLVGIWLLSKKQWNALVGILAGGILLFGMGAAYDPFWVKNYLVIGGGAFDKYFGYQPTIWGVAGYLFDTSWLRLLAAIVGVSVIVAITGLFVARRNLTNDPFQVVAILTAVTLLISPYAWNYELVFLIIPLLYILIRVSSSCGDLMAALFSSSFLGLSIILYFVANSQGYDVWSMLLSVIAWGVLLFVLRPMEEKLTTS